MNEDPGKVSSLKASVLHWVRFLVCGFRTHGQVYRQGVNLTTFTSTYLFGSTPKDSARTRNERYAESAVVRCWRRRLVTSQWTEVVPRRGRRQRTRHRTVWILWPSAASGILTITRTFKDVWEPCEQYKIILVCNISIFGCRTFCTKPIDDILTPSDVSLHSAAVHGRNHWGVGGSGPPTFGRTPSFYVAFLMNIMWLCNWLHQTV